MYCYYFVTTLFSAPGFQAMVQKRLLDVLEPFLPNFVKKQKGSFANLLELDVNTVKIFSFTYRYLFSQVKESASCVDVLC